MHLSLNMSANLHNVSLCAGVPQVWNSTILMQDNQHNIGRENQPDQNTD